MEKEKCEYCGKSEPSYNLVRVDFGNGEYVTLCNDCNNQDMALLLGIKDKKDFIKNYIATDTEGKKHQFEIRKRMLEGWSDDKKFYIEDKAIIDYKYVF